MISWSLNNRLKSHPLWVFILFALGIVIPAVFLSVLGFRSFQYESKLMHKQLEERYVTVADAMQRQLQESFQSPLRQLRAVALTPSFSAWDRHRMTSRLVGLDSLDAMAIESVYLFDAQNHMVFPAPRVGASSLPEHDVDWGFYSDEIQRLERLEFGQKKSREALAGYLVLSKQSLSPSQQAALLKNIGAAAHRLGDDRMAESAYLRLIREYDSLMDPSGLPYGLLARWLLARHEDSVGLYERAAVLRLDILEGLLLDRWGFLPARDTWTVTLSKELEQGRSARTALSEESRARWNRLKDLSQRTLAAESRAAAFSRTDWPAALQRLQRHGWQVTGGILRLGTSTDSRWLFSTPVFNVSGNQQRGVLVAIMPSEKLWARASVLLEDIAHPAGLRVAFSGQEPASLSGWKTAIQRTLDQLDPPLTFSIYKPFEQTEDQLSRKRLWIYAGMVGLSLLVIVIGLGLMGLAVRRELEIATLKSDFVASVSHELRTPLSAIAYIAERLTRGRYRSAEEAKDFYGMLSEETGRLQELIEDVLDFSKTLSGKKVYHLEPVDIVLVVREALDRTRSKVEEAGFEVRLQMPDGPLRVQADSRAAVHALTNLLDNAIKYSGSSKILILAAQEDERWVRVTVTDYGIGIPAAELTRIFERFYRVEKGAAADVQSGVGLGLAMVKHIMQNHHGDVEVRSTIGQGSTFTLKFPRGGNERTPV